MTGAGIIGQIELPTTYGNDTSVFLGDKGPGYPPTLYPNLTYDTSPGFGARYGDLALDNNATLLLGPLFLKSNSSILSITVPVNNNTSRVDILGWLTVVLDAKALHEVSGSRVGLGSTGEVLIIGPSGQPDNMFAEKVDGRSEAQNADVPVQFMLPPYSNRHPARIHHPSLPFPMKDYPAVLTAWSDINGQLNNAGVLMSTHNEEGRKIAVGYARVDSNVVNWVISFGQAHSEVFAPINKLRRTIIASIFSVVGAIMLVCL